MDVVCGWVWGVDGCGGWMDVVGGWGGVWMEWWVDGCR